MFYYLIYNSTIIKKDNPKNKNVTTLIYGTIIYIVIHAFIYMNKTVKENLLRYFWLILSVDIVSMFLTSEITSDIQKHNFFENDEPENLNRKKKKRIKVNVEEEKVTQTKPILKEKKKISSKKSSSLEEIRKHNQKVKNDEKVDIQETQDILDEIDKNVIEDKNVKKNVTFNVPDDAKSEISEGSDLELDLESFEKSLLED